MDVLTDIMIGHGETGSKKMRLKTDEGQSKGYNINPLPGHSKL